VSATIRMALRAVDDDNLEACGHGLREGCEVARLAGNAGIGNFYDALGALVDAERDRRARRPVARRPRLGERLAALTNGELLALAMKATIDAPPVDDPAVVAFLKALADLLNGECRRRAA
jgi:hypothetical protein